MATRPKPPISLWIVSERKRHGWKAEELSRRLLDAGYPAEVSTVRVWEAGRSPQADTIEALERLFGSVAPREQDVRGDSAAFLRAIETQTEMLEKQWAATTALVGHLGDLVQEMRASRAEAQGRDEALVDILAELRTVVRPPSSGGEGARRQRSSDGQRSRS